MAHSVDELLKLTLGDLILANVQLTAQIEALREQVAKATPPTPPDPPATQTP